MESLLTVLMTVLSGIMVFILGEYIKEIWLTPLQDYRKIRSKISYALTFYAQFYNNPVEPAEIPEEYKSASKELRNIAAETQAFIETIHWLHLGIPSKQKLHNASKSLIGLSNSLQKPHLGDSQPIIESNIEREEKICKLLRIYKSPT